MSNFSVGVGHSQASQNINDMSNFANPASGPIQPMSGFVPDPNPNPSNPLPPDPQSLPTGATASSGPPAGAPGGSKNEMDDLEARLNALQGL